MSDEIKMSAMDFGFDANWIADLLQKFGGDILSLAIEACRQGLSVGLVVELLDKFGPALLEFVVNLLQTKHAMALTAVVDVDPFVPGPNDPTPSPAPLPANVDNAFLDLILTKYLPLLIEKYGPQLLQAFVEFVLKFLKK